jgi:phenylalanyl-tRNA synthetase beta chain
MRIPLSWLRESVDLAPDVTPEEVHQALVRVGLEEEDIHRFDVSGPVVVGQVVDFVDEPQSNGKTIRWCQVKVAESDDDRGPAIRGIVCGANNFEAGDKVVVTLPGAVLPGGFEIAARKTYGHVSDGMIASAKELGLGDDHSGILRLQTLGLDPDVGEDAIRLLGLDDVAVEVNVTPDRGYALSMRGIAREYHHSTGAPFTDPATRVVVGEGSGFPVSLADSKPIRGVPGCTQFIARVVRGIDATAPTPPFMVSRLALAGMRSISLPVDITNYVMLELGQPIHGYDLDSLTGGITVRRAQPGETLTTLDGQERALDPEDLLITDESGPIGLAGVMGGATTEMGESTTSVLIEAAWFDPVSIARTARRHKLPSEAQKRFQRGVDPNVADAAAQRVADLLVAHAGGTIDSLGARVVVDDWPVATEISFTESAVTDFVGIEVSGDEVWRILADIGCRVTGTGATRSVTAPSWRPDLVDWPTLVEEVARIVGFDKIPSILPIAPAGRGLTATQQAKRRIMQGLCAGGLTEVLSYPFVTPEQNRMWTVDAGSPQDGVRVANALDDQVSRLRVSLIPGLLDTVRRNRSRGLTDLALVEAGNVFQPRESLGTTDIPLGAVRPDEATIQTLNDSLPHQPWHVGAVFVGRAEPEGVGVTPRASDISDAIDAAKKVARLAGGDLQVLQATHPSFHPGRFGHLVAKGVTVGIVGEVLPRIAAELDLPRRVAVFAIDGDLLLETLGHEPVTMEPLSGYPAATQDVSLVVSTDLPVAELRSVFAEATGPLLEHIALIDVYRGEGVSADQQSVTFSLRFRAADRTLTQEEATEAKQAGIAEVSARFGATLRG